MKKILFVIVVLIMAVGLVSCGKPAEVVKADEVKPQEVAEVVEELEESEPQESVSESAESISSTDIVFQGEHPYEEQFEIWDTTTEVFSEELLKELHADGFTGTDEQIAQQIADWQKEYMLYATPGTNGVDQVGWGGRWNMMIPGIYPASKRIENKTSDGKIYGVCHDFAAIYVAIANAYGIESRVATFPLQTHKEVYGQYPTDVPTERYRGLGRDEYDVLNVLLVENGIDLSYDQIHRAIQGVSTVDGHIMGQHSRAQVMVDGKWIPFDMGMAPDLSGADNPYNDNSYYIPQNWDGIYNPIRLYAPAFLDTSIEHAPLDIEGLIQYRSYGPQVMFFTGVTDDYGNENRASCFDDFVRGDALIPYFNSVEKVSEFLHLPDDRVDDILDDAPEILIEYEQATGKPFYIIADFFLYGDVEEMSAEEYVPLYNALTGGDMTNAEFNELIK